jgi:hypothetical protein
MLRQFANWLRRDGYLQNLVGLLLAGTFVGWVLVPLLNIVSAYVLFGLIFLALAIIIWRTVRPTTIGFLRKVATAILGSASATFILYAMTLFVKGEEGGLWWALPGVGVLAALVLLVRLFPVREARTQGSQYK